MKLTDHELFLVWEYALIEMQSKAKAKGKNENDKVFLARCWEAGLNKVMQKAGYKCVKQDSSQS